MNEPAKHAPGPWTCEEAGDHWVIASETAWIGTIYHGHGGNPEQTEPNAHLVASAPDLLSIAQELLAIYEGPQPVRHDTIDDLRAAITKATGAPKP